MLDIVWRAAIAATLILALAQCNTSDEASAGRYGPDGGGRKGGLVSRLLGGDDAAGVRPGAMQRGTDQFFNADALSDQTEPQAVVVPAGGDNVELVLVNASIESAAKAVLGDALGLNYVVSDKVKGTVTVQTTGPVPKSVLLELFETALASNDARITREGNVVQIVPGRSGASTFRLAGAAGQDGSRIIVAPLKYISANEMAGLLDPLVADGLQVVADRRRNLLLISGPTQLQGAALEALNLFDVDVLAGKSVALVSLNSADPDAVVADLTHIFETEEGGALSGVVEFIPNRRLSSVLVVSSRAQYLEKAQRWIRQLDTTADGASTYLATYHLQNRNAAEVAPILNGLLSSEKIDTQGESDGSSSADVEGGARVAADEGRNALIVNARRSEHNQIRAMLAELDSAPRQVMLEATIAEVALKDDVSIGTRWFFESGNWDFRFSDLQSGGVSADNPSFAAVFGVGSAEVAISALESVTDVKVISAPTLMVLDNKEGILQIGDQVPVAVQTATSAATTDAPVLTQIDYRDTGVILRVKPRIGNGGRVVLDISQEVSNVAENKTSGIDSPTIRQRKIQTSVSLADGQTLALGGLVQEGDDKTKAQVPGLGRVPVVGNLFRHKESKKERTELLIMIRPKVVEGDSDAAAVTSSWRAKLSGANSVLAKGLGSPRHALTDFVE